MYKRKNYTTKFTESRLINEDLFASMNLHIISTRTGTTWKLQLCLKPVLIKKSAIN